MVNYGSVGKAQNSSLAATDLQCLRFPYFGLFKILECFTVFTVLILQYGIFTEREYRLEGCVVSVADSEVVEKMKP